MSYCVSRMQGICWKWTAIAADGEDPPDFVQSREAWTFAAASYKAGASTFPNDDEYHVSM